MAKIDREFVEKLDNFTKSLESVVELLKEQAKGSETDVSDKLIEGLSTEVFSNITDQVKKAISESKEIGEMKTDVSTIKKAVEQDKERKETGMFGTVGETKNKKKIVEGISAIVLIAGGVLAIGMAFKLIGKVDVLSVIALGIGMLAVAKAFAEVASIKDLTYEKVLMVSSIFPIMALAILASSYFLNMVDTIGFMELLTIVAVGVTMSAAVALILWGLKDTKLDNKSVASLMMLPTIMPIVASAIVLSSYILSAVAPMTFETMKNVIFASIAMAPAAIIVLMLAKLLKGGTMDDKVLESFDKSGKLKKLTSKKGTKGVTPKDILLTVAVLPIIAAGIVVSSWILQLTAPIKNPIDVMLTGVVIGVTTLAMMPTIILITKSKVKLEDIALGALAVVMVSAAIMLSSWLISFGNYEKYPSLDWVGGVGLSMLIFGGATLVFGALILASGGTGFIALALGALAVVIVAATITATSYILGAGSYDKYPSADWSGGVGLSMLVFGTGMMLLGVFIFATLGFGLAMLAAGGAAMLIVATSIVEASKILGGGNYDKYPTLDWASGVSLAIKTFSDVLVQMTYLDLLSGFFGGGKVDLNKFIITISLALVTAANVFNRSGGAFDESKVPSKKWADGVGTAVATFSNALLAFDDMGLDTPGEIIGATRIIALAIIAAGDVFNKYGGKFDDTKVPSKKWAEGVGGSLASFSTAIKDMDEALDVEDPEEVIGSMVSVAAGLIIVGRIFNKFGSFDDTKVPSKSWAEGVGGAISIFAKSMAEMDETIDVDDPEEVIASMSSIAFAIAFSGRILSQFGVFDDTKIPSKEWAEGVGNTIIMFAKSMAEMDEYVDVDKPDEILAFMTSISFGIAYAGIMFNKIPDTAPEKLMKLGNSLKNFLSGIPNNMYYVSLGIKMLATSIEELGDVVNDLETQSIKNLSKLSGSLLTISVIDQESLANTLNVIEEKSASIKAISDEGNTSMLGDLTEWIGDGVKGVIEGGEEIQTKKSPMQEMLDHVKNIDDKMTKLVENSEKQKNIEVKRVEEEELKKPKMKLKS